MHGMTLPEWIDATRAALARIGERLGMEPGAITEQETKFFCDVEPAAAAAMIAFTRVSAHRTFALETKTRVLDVPVGKA